MLFVLFLKFTIILYKLLQSNQIKILNCYWASEKRKLTPKLLLVIG